MILVGTLQRIQTICQIQISTRRYLNRNRTLEFWIPDTLYIRSQDFSQVPGSD